MGMIISNITDPTYYSGELIEWMIFGLVLGVVLFGIPISLNFLIHLDHLLGTGSNKEFFKQLLSHQERRLLKIVVGLILILFTSGVIQKFYDIRNEEKRFLALIKDLEKDHRVALEEQLTSLEDGSNLLPIKEALYNIWYNHEQVSLVDIVFQFGKSKEGQFGLIDFKTPDSLLASGNSNELLFTLLPEEKKLISELISKEINPVEVVRLFDGELRGYSLIKTKGKVWVLRFHPRYDHILIRS